MKKRLIACLASVFVFGTLFTGCSSADSGKEGEATGEKPSTSTEDMVIAGIYKAGDQVWFIDEGKAAENKAKEMGASKFIYIDAKMNPDTYLQSIDNAIAQKVSGIVTCVPDQTLSQVVVDKLKAANIPAVAADDALQDASGKKLVPWVGIDAYNIGQTNGEWMANYMNENKLVEDEGSAILMLTMDTVSSCVPRTVGALDKIKEMIPNYPDSKVFKADYNGETDKGFNAAAAIITANPQIKKWVVTAPNDEGAVGAVRALEQAGLDKESCVVGLGGYLAKDEFKKEYSALKAAAYFSSDAVGGTSVQILIDYIKEGKEMPMETAVPATIVTRENYKEVMGKNAE